VSAPSNVIETHGLTKRFGARVAVADLELAVPAGVAFGFLGPNGAGKTTTIRMLLGLTRPSDGQAAVLGHDMPREHSAALARVGAIVEEPHFHGHLTGRENLRVVAAARERDAHGRIPAALERVGLSARADDKVKSYSLGMRQRLGIARCLLADPLLLILDEPMNGLDPAGILEMRQLIRSFVDEGRTVFLSSHLLDEVEKTCDSVAIVDQGRVITQGKTTDIAAAGQDSLLLTVDDAQKALALLSDAAAVKDVALEGGRLRLHLADPAAAAAVNRLLVEAGVNVSRLEGESATLEQRFLEITSKLGESA
jgi:ABC-2 type transport system ATP-binding protein